MFKSLKFEEIDNEFINKKNSHSYIFYTSDFFSCQQDVLLLVKKLFKTHNLNLIQSDFVTISRNEKKQILKDDMLELKNFFQNTSYINDYRIYLVEEAHKLNSSSANLILKFLEEPMDGVIAFFITDNLDAVLPTIKSRCQIVNIFYNVEDKSNTNDYELLEKNLFDNNKFYSLIKIKKIFEKLERNELIEMFKGLLLHYYESDLNSDNLNKIKLLNDAIILLNCNVNVDYVFDYVLLGGRDK